MAATAVSPSQYLDPKQHQHSHINFNPTITLPFISSKNILLPLQKRHLYNCRCRCSLPSSSSSLSSSSPSSTSSLTPFLDDPFRGTPFLSNEELENLKALETFLYLQELESGSLSVRVMRTEEMDLTSGLLAESFAESMLMPLGYGVLMKFLVSQYLIERRAVMPHAVTLVGFFRERNGGEEKGNELAGTVEVCFDEMGASTSPPTPMAPKNSPYICNMTVSKQLRRKGIGWHLLRASEELISQMASSKEVYLHCRMIDEAPFNMYIKAGYDVVQTDSILILLTLQRRKHLMCKKLPFFNSSPESDVLDSSEELL